MKTMTIRMHLLKKNRIKSNWMISNKVHYIFFVKLKYSYHSKVHRKSGNEIRSEKNSKAKNLKNRHRLIRNICIYFRDALQYIWPKLKKTPLFTVFFYFKLLQFHFKVHRKSGNENWKILVKSLLFIKNSFIYFRVVMQHIWQTSKKNLKTIPIIAKVKTAENGTRNLEFDIMPEL